LERREDEEKSLCDEDCREAVITKYRFGSILQEREILSRLLGLGNNFDFIQHECVFQDGDDLYLVVDYFCGGDLLYESNRPEINMLEVYGSSMLELRI
jgi:hypothetical protein